MVLMAAVGISVGGWIQIARWGKLRELYKFQAESHADVESLFRVYADRTHEEWLSDCRDVEKRNEQCSLGLTRLTSSILVASPFW